MGSPNIRDLLTAFSPSSEFFAISSGDGRIKIWDTLKGQIQTEFVDIAANDLTDAFMKPDRGHLSVDYTCMKWLDLGKKRKRKHGGSLIVLGTGGGDVLALDVASGELRWRISDCHPGGVTAISFSEKGSRVYTGGADGMICEIDPVTGNSLKRFKTSTKAISSISVSSDGSVLASASAQVKIYSCSDQKKIQKFSGHPGAVRSMIFTNDGKYVLSCAAGERYIAVWRVDGSKMHSASCTLSMEHPAVYLDSRCFDNGEEDLKGLYVLALTETGVCYFWFGQNIEELRNSIPAKVSLSIEDSVLKNHHGAPTILAAKLQGIPSRASGHIFISHGLLVKPLFQKILVHSGKNMNLNSSLDGILLPTGQSLVRAKRGQDVRNKVTALDRANAEDALHPIPTFTDLGETKKPHQYSGIDPDDVIADIVNSRSQAKSLGSEQMHVSADDDVEVGTSTICLEDHLRSLGFIGRNDGSFDRSAPDPAFFKDINLEANLSNKKIRDAILSMGASDAYNLLRKLLSLWQSRSSNAKLVLPWISRILVIHSDYVLSQEPMTELLYSFGKTAKARGAVIQPLLQLVGRLQFVAAQIDKATHDQTRDSLHERQADESDDEDEDIDHVFYRDEDESGQTSDDTDDD
ncbi:uncharacterized protein LOC104436824 isoform X6 [Eucalyptus grandis]|uniref:uncharacterized protein LOC104436824 isoform X6 n=1 Tax=Eucalyptus grandis TaxID=71139 RepID=UPI00192ED6A2|nr:uncharacterized protein LOC104436824 isoform X6 [Eucalyptus grandis]